MHKIWVVLRREFIARVRTKWFVLSTVLGPVLMALFVFLPVLMASGGGRERSIAVLDATTTGFGARVTDVLNTGAPITASRMEVELVRLEDVADSLAAAVGVKELDGFLIVTDQTVADGRAEYRGSNAAAQLDMEIMERFVARALLTERLSDLGVDPQKVTQASSIPLNLQTVTIRGGEATEQSGETTFIMAYIMWFLLYMAILLYGVQVLGAVVEEKTTRIVEVLVSSLRPFELLAGKVVGVGAVGLFQLLIWAVTARLLLTQREVLGRMMGLETSAQAFPLPEVPVSTIVVLLVYFVLGYFLYAAMFAAVAAMSSSEAEARQAQAPVTLFYAIPAVVSLMAMLTEPDGALFIALTLIPLSSPISMPGRWVVSDVSLVELIGSVLLLVLGLIIVTWIAGRIYRVGILMYGKRPSPREVIRWVRAA
ncbi:MAG: ABC transporter permease [Gemmatimonadota bacterium]|nr:MAG: ABC transporter permease [Gemmatimonadota bacterium]